MKIRERGDLMGFPSVTKCMLTGLITALLICLSGWCGYLVSLRVSGNFHVVAQNALYRSALPSKRQLGSYVRAVGIRTVVNLCAPAESIETDEEARRVKKLGLAYLRYPLPKRRLLTAREILEVLHAIQAAPKPVLIHSYFGSDRVGLIAAVYLVALEGKSVAEASKQLSPAYGHLRFMGTEAMDKTFRVVASIHGAPMPNRDVPQ